VLHPVTDACKLADKIGWVERTAHVDMALYGTNLKTGGVGASPELVASGISAFKFSTYEYGAGRLRASTIQRWSTSSRRSRTDLPAVVHIEDQEPVERLTAEARAARRTEAMMHCRTRPPMAETVPDVEIFEIGLQPGARVHIAQSSLARGFVLAETFRGMGVQASGEARIQYLCMTEDDLVWLGGGGKCNPPFRTSAEVQLMWTILPENKVAYGSTDHSPWPLARKALADIFACSAAWWACRVLLLQSSPCSTNVDCRRR
jgi:allantoinase